jgi:hypothetical protein
MPVVTLSLGVTCVVLDMGKLPSKAQAVGLNGEISSTSGSHKMILPQTARLRGAQQQARKVLIITMPCYENEAAE